MLDLKQIELFYPESLRPFKRNLLLEYLQYKILEIIFDSEFGEKLAFIQQVDRQNHLSAKLL
ncbi:hypothetical protein HKBW3S25_01007 [Candidatus Hakubella thermalkaliphila]|uniref:Uncharacterized protein n=1 Tax=Candidatus Hakubella thermalkaliphila TaxID=2754717 RepID=A0A6V8NZ87_9ACTN|nr:hypothetical protein HKBW3S25_01007 [Candidatus Hakubella thermalkaliphila]